MSRLTFEDVTPEEYPPRFVDYSGERADAHRDSNPPTQPWTLVDVYAYRSALIELGFTDEQVAAQIAKDCGPEFANVSFVRGAK
jgi:hypothetical protein